MLKKKKGKRAKFYLTKIKSLCSVPPAKRLQRQTADWKNISANHSILKGLIVRIYKEFSKPNIKKKKTHTKNSTRKWAKHMKRRFTKEDTQTMKKPMRRRATSLAVVRVC